MTLILQIMFIYYFFLLGLVFSALVYQNLAHCLLHVALLYRLGVQLKSLFI